MSSNSLRLFTSESVTEGHPDKVCDRISDSILDAILAQDPVAHVAVETMVTTGLVHVAGEVTTDAYVEIPEIVRSEIVSIGYTSSEVCFDGASCGVSISIGQQSPDIAAGVDKALEVRGAAGGVSDAGGLDPLDFTRERGTEEALPWDHIHPGVRKDFLLRERRRAYEGKLSPNCRDGCAGCGLGCREAAL